MIILDSTTEKLQLVLAGAITTTALDWTASFIDIVVGTSYTPGNSDGTSNNTTDVDIVAAPAASTQRQVKQITVYNNDTVGATVSIKKDTSGVDKILCKVFLDVGDTLQYSDSEGFSIADNMGSILLGPNARAAISAGTQSVSTGTVVFSNSNSVSFGMNASSQITASINSLTLSQSFFEVKHGELQSYTENNSAAVNFKLQQVLIPFNITVTRLDLIANMTNNGATNGTWSISAVVYTRSKQTLFSASSTNSGVNWASGGATSDTGSYSGVSGTRVRSLAPASWAFSPGEYWFGFLQTWSGPAGTTPGISMYGQNSVSIMGIPGGQNDVVGQFGDYSSGVTSIPDSINLYDLMYANSVAGSAQPYRKPYFRMFGTY